MIKRFFQNAGINIEHARSQKSKAIHLKPSNSITNSLGSKACVSKRKSSKKTKKGDFSTRSAQQVVKKDDLEKKLHLRNQPLKHTRGGMFAEKDSLHPASGYHESKKKIQKNPISPKKQFAQKPNKILCKKDHDLADAILLLLKKEPLKRKAIARALLIHSRDELLLQETLSQLEKKRKILQRGKEYCILPKSDNGFIGKLQVHATGSAHLLDENPGGKDLFIPAENLGVALHGDRVMAHLVEQRYHSRRSGHVGQIVSVLERAGSPIVGIFKKTKNIFSVVANDPRFPRDLYVSDPKGAKIGDKVVAQLDQWENRDMNPVGHIVEVLGPADAPGMDMISLIHKHGLPRKFPAEVNTEAKRFGIAISEADRHGRDDLRGHTLLTIDPDSAHDFDDAIEVQPIHDGWSVAIHIADVSHYVKPGTALDKEARLRGNSVYLADRVIPMLPEHLSNGLCSLKPNEDRLAFSVLTEISKKGVIRNVNFRRSLIRSAARLTYKEAFELLQKPPKDEIARRLHSAWECAVVLRKKRFLTGALDLDMPEVKVVLDAQGIPVKLELIENDIAHQLIEEMMLLANEIVASHLKRKRQPNIYRIHEKPEPEKLNEYRKLAATYGVKAGNLNHRSEMQKLLDGLKNKPYATALKIGLLKSLKRARYAADPLGHFGLSKANYSHFTSPIRRYADLLTHRSLARDLDPKQPGSTSIELGQLSTHLSMTEQIAADAEKESVRLKKLEYFSKLADTPAMGGIAPSFSACIIEARSYGLLVELPEAMMVGLVPYATLDDDSYFFDSSRSRLVGKKSKRIFKAGDFLRVKVLHVDFFKQKIDFRIDRDPQEFKKRKKSASNSLS